MYTEDNDRDLLYPFCCLLVPRYDNDGPSGGGGSATCSATYARPDDYTDGSATYGSVMYAPPFDPRVQGRPPLTHVCKEVEHHRATDWFTGSHLCDGMVSLTGCSDGMFFTYRVCFFHRITYCECCGN